MKQGNRHYSKRFLSFLLAFAMLMTAGGFDNMTGVVKKASAATTITLENMQFYDEIGGDPTPIDGTINNTNSNSMIHMDVMSSLTFDINAGGAEWMAYLADANQTILSDGKFYFTNRKDDTNLTAVKDESKVVDYKSLGITMQMQGDNGLKITTGKNLNKNVVYYLYVVAVGHEETYIFSRIYLYNPVEKMTIKGDPSITTPRKRSWYVPTSGQDNSGESAWRTKAGTTETTDGFTWEISEKPQYEVVKDSIKLTEVTPSSGRASQADLQTAAITAPDKVTISVKVDDGIKQTAGATEIKAMRARNLDPATFGVSIIRGNPSRKIDFTNAPAYYKQTEDGYNSATEEDIQKGTGLPTYEVQVGKSFALRPNMKCTVDDTSRGETDEFSWAIRKEDASVLAYDKDGKVTGKKTGYAEVTVTGDDPTVTAKCYIHVYTEADALTLYRNRVDASTKLTTDNTGNNTLSVRGKSTVTVYVEETTKTTGGTPDENLIVTSADTSMLEISDVANTDKNNIKKFTFKVLQNVTATTEKEIHITTKRVNDSGEQIEGLSATLKVYINPPLSSESNISLKLGNETIETEEVKIYYDGKTNATTKNPKTFEFTATTPNSAEGQIDQYDWELRDENDQRDEKKGENYTWTTEDNKISITPYATGRFLLRARSSSNPDLVKEVIVYVARQADSLKITDPSNKTLYLTPGETADIAYEEQPGEADEDIDWTTDPAWTNESEAAVVVKGGKVQAKKETNAAVKVIAKTKYSGKQDTCTVHIYQMDSLQITDSKGFALPEFEAVYNETAAQTLKIAVTDTRGNKISGPNVIWTSGDTSIAQVVKKNATDATLSFIGAGETQITATCGGKTVTMNLKVAKKEISKASMKSIVAQTFTGNAITPAVALTDKNEPLSPGVDYDFVYEDNIDASSKAKVILTGKGNYTGTSEKNFTINRASLDNVSFSKIPDQYVSVSSVYLMPEPEMYLGDYKLQPYLLDTKGNYVINEKGERQALDCQLKYENNTTPGTASVTITGIGNFSGTKKLEFAVGIKDSFVSPATKVRIEPIGSAVYENTQATNPAGSYYVADGDRIYINTGKTNIAQFRIMAESDTGNCDDMVYASTPDSNKFFGCTTSTTNAEATNALVTIEGKKAGTETLYIYSVSGLIQKQINVVVLQPATKMQIMAPIDKKDTDVTGGTVNMIENHSIQFSTKYTPSDCTDTVDWTVSNPEVATISETGLLTTKKEGNVFVTAKIADSKVGSNPLSATVSVHVTRNSPATSITLDQDAIILKAGEKKELNVTVLPANNTEELQWSSDNENVATVTKAGEVTAVADGVAKITCSNFAGTISDTCIVNVSTPATALTLSTHEKAMKAGETLNLTAALTPETAADVIEWTSSDNTVVSITNPTAGVPGNTSTVTIKALKSGKAEVTATAKTTGVTNKCTISVTGKGGNLDDDITNSNKPGKVKLSKVKNVKKRSMKITWKKVSGANGYQVAYGTKKNFKGAKKKVLKKTSLTVKKLKKKKTYYVRVRAYKTVNGEKAYGAWSAKKKVKIKK